VTYSILCDARKGENLGIDYLGLVDRKITKRIWWTSDDANLLLRYHSQSAADFVAKRLRLNNARVVPSEQAASVITRQAQRIRLHNYGLGDDDQSWDAHKS
jgi:hypothetical protein